MDTPSTASILGLPTSTRTHTIANRALAAHCAGGRELCAAKEFLGAVANDARAAIRRSNTATFTAANEARADVAVRALAKLAEIQRAMLHALELAKELPPGSLTSHVQSTAPAPEAQR